MEVILKRLNKNGIIKDIISDKGQIVIPAKARKLFNISPGDDMIVLGDENQGLALVNAQLFITAAEDMKNGK